MIFVFKKRSTDGALNLKWTNPIFESPKKSWIWPFFRNENKADLVLRNHFTFANRKIPHWNHQD